MKKIIIIIAIAISFLIIFFIGLHFVGIPRYFQELEIKEGLDLEITYNAEIYYEKNNHYAKKLCYITKNYIEHYNILFQEIYSSENKNVLDDFYYRYGSNWYEFGYFTIKPGNRKAEISGTLYKSSTNYICKTINLNAIDFYKTNTIFKNGLFNKITTVP